MDGSELPPVAELTLVLSESDGLTVGVRLRIALDLLEVLGDEGAALEPRGPGSRLELRHVRIDGEGIASARAPGGPTGAALLAWEVLAARPATSPTPAELRSLMDDVPEAVDALIGRALRGEGLATVAELAGALEEASRGYLDTHDDVRSAIQAWLRQAPAAQPPAEGEAPPVPPSPEPAAPEALALEQKSPPAPPAAEPTPPPTPEPKPEARIEPSAEALPAPPARESPPPAVRVSPRPAVPQAITATATTPKPSAGAAVPPAQGVPSRPPAPAFMGSAAPAIRKPPPPAPKPPAAAADAPGAAPAPAKPVAPPADKPPNRPPPPPLVPRKPAPPPTRASSPAIDSLPARSAIGSRPDPLAASDEDVDVVTSARPEALAIKPAPPPPPRAAPVAPPEPPKPAPEAHVAAPEEVAAASTASLRPRKSDPSSAKKRASLRVRAGAKSDATSPLPPKVDSIAPPKPSFFAGRSDVVALLFAVIVAVLALFAILGSR